MGGVCLFYIGAGRGGSAAVLLSRPSLRRVSSAARSVGLFPVGGREYDFHQPSPAAAAEAEADGLRFDSGDWTSFDDDGNSDAHNGGARGAAARAARAAASDPGGLDVEAALILARCDCFAQKRQRRRRRPEETTARASRVVGVKCDSRTIFDLARVCRVARASARACVVYARALSDLAPDLAAAHASVASGTANPFLLGRWACSGG